MIVMLDSMQAVLETQSVRIALSVHILTRQVLQFVLTALPIKTHQLQVKMTLLIVLVVLTTIKQLLDKTVLLARLVRHQLLDRLVLIVLMVKHQFLDRIVPNALQVLLL